MPKLIKSPKGNLLKHIGKIDLAVAQEIAVFLQNPLIDEFVLDSVNIDTDEARDILTGAIKQSSVKLFILRNSSDLPKSSMNLIASAVAENNNITHCRLDDFDTTCKLVDGGKKNAQIWHVLHFQVVNSITPDKMGQINDFAQTNMQGMRLALELDNIAIPDSDIIDQLVETISKSRLYAVELKNVANMPVAAVEKFVSAIANNTNIKCFNFDGTNNFSEADTTYLNSQGKFDLDVTLLSEMIVPVYVEPEAHMVVTGECAAAHS